MHVQDGICPLCGSKESRALYEGMRDRLGIYSKAFGVLSCMGCGTAFLEHIPSGDELAALYPAEYIIKDDTGQSPLMGLWKRAEMRLFYLPAYRKDVRSVLRATGLAGGRYLDVGCGNGGRLSEFAAAGFEVEGLETSQVDVDYIKSRLGYKAQCGTLTGLDFEPGYSLITFFNVLEHLPDPEQTLRKVYGLLRPGGYIAIWGPVADSIQARMLGRRWIEIAEMPRHIFIPSTKGLYGALGRAGFTGVNIMPVSAFRLAHTLAESLVPGAIGADAYRRGRLAAVLTRAAGASVMLLSLPLALIEGLSGRACVKLVLARKPEGQG